MQVRGSEKIEGAGSLPGGHGSAKMSAQSQSQKMNNKN